jgi:hypothetical protein
MVVGTPVGSKDQRRWVLLDRIRIDELGVSAKVISVMDSFIWWVLLDRLRIDELGASAKVISVMDSFI